ncbi:MAG: hypothetical protein WCB97_14375 [Thiobacillus sp.]
MKTLRPILFASLLALSSPLLAQEAHPHHGGAVAAAPAPEVESIAPAPAGKGGCEKCKKSGMGGKMAAGDMGEMGGMGGKSCCGGMHGGGDTAALERRISELEKRLDLMQALLQRKTR